ncbi:hypothetical protein [Methylobacterium gossipiicola]|uniref:Uncharacterized protein n=1 Tax=Methylobacterium gossipiicola TaxID=582675 RepID=A0A1I2RVN1_9HYPH|nr:hypothetical protein [Methylobacterium gossipiicola]SFG41816.1 hypothetical protein SAMN05192565_10312 [Methylobacterium gossipiicola]
MTEQTDKRAERLKAALRENLRRRKAQVRGRSDRPPVVTQDGDPPQPVGQPDDARPREDDDPT